LCNENRPIQHDADVDVPYTSGWILRSDGSRVWGGVKTARRFRNNLVGLPGLMHMAALTISANSDLTAEQVVSILKQTASKDLNLEGYPRTLPASFDPNPTWDVSPIAPFERGNFIDIGAPEGSWSPWLDEAATRRKKISNHCITPGVAQCRAPSNQREVYHEKSRNEPI
jgi:hypothetical protein